MTTINHNRNQMIVNGKFKNLIFIVTVGLMILLTTTAISKPVLAIEPVSISLTTLAVTNPDGCRVSSALGWLVCPLMDLLSSVADGGYGLLSNFLTLDQKVLTFSPNVGSENPAKAAWSVVRDIANIGFVITFLIVIGSYLTGFGLTSYNIKKMLPKMIVGIILINFSFYLVQIAIDLSNIVGSSLWKLFDAMSNGIIDRAMPALNNGEYIGELVTSAGIGFVGIIAAIMAMKTAAISFVAIAFPLLVSAALTIIMTVIILYARNAVTIILAVSAPIAFASMILPNTESFYKLWKKTLWAIVLTFPIISLLFGASSMAGKILSISAGDNLILKLLAASLEVLPLIMAPSLIKNSMTSVPLVGNKLTGLLAKGQSQGRQAAKNSQITRSSRQKSEHIRSQIRLGRKIPSKSGVGKIMNAGLNLSAIAHKKIYDSKFGTTQLGTSLRAAEVDKAETFTESMANGMTFDDAKVILDAANSGQNLNPENIKNIRTRQIYLDSGKDIGTAQLAAALTKAKAGKLGEKELGEVINTNLQNYQGNSQIVDRMADKIGAASFNKGSLDVSSAVYNQRYLKGSMVDASGKKYQPQTQDEFKSYLQLQSPNQLANMHPDMFNDEDNYNLISGMYHDPARAAFKGSIDQARLSSNISPGTAQKLQEIANGQPYNP